MAGKAKPDLPLWKRRTQPQGPVITVTGHRARQLTRDLRAAARAQAAAAGGTSPPPGLLARSGAYRFRYQLVPFAWLGWMLAVGLGSRAAHKAWLGVVFGAALAAALWLGSRSLSAFARKASAASAVITAAWVPVAALGAPWRPAVGALVVCWGLVTAPWVHQYRWRHEDVPPRPDLTDAQIWEERIAARRLKGTWLDQRTEIRGGRQWTVMLPHGDIVPADVIANADRIAGAFDKPSTEVVVEQYPDGRQSRATLIILDGDTLAVPRDWDGRGVDPATGMGVIGRFADGQDAHVRLWVPRDGTRHGLIAGATGSGKSYALDLLIRLAVASGRVVPVVLDPQEGQSLPAWRGKVLYAAGVAECMKVLVGIHLAMFTRSRRLAQELWADESGHQMRGMDFFDPEVTGLPVILVIADEFPLLLTSTKQTAKRGALALSIASDIAKLGRKTGVSLWPVAQVPSLSELGDQVLRSMLVGGNVVSLRTGDRVSAGMLGLDADPSTLPRYFPNGEPTWGLGYVVGPDNRQAPARIDRVTSAVRRVIPPVPPLDDEFAAAMALAACSRELAEALNSEAAPAFPSPTVAVAGAVESAADGTVADAIVAVVKREMDRGEVLAAVAKYAEGHGRKPWSLSSVTHALPELVAAGRISSPRRNRYAPRRPGLHVVNSNPPAF